MKRKPPSPKKRLHHHKEEVLYGDFWAKRFAQEGDKSIELLEMQLKDIEKSQRRVARLETHIARKSR